MSEKNVACLAAVLLGINLFVLAANVGVFTGGFTLGWATCQNQSEKIEGN